MTDERRAAGFKRRTPLADARERLLSVIEPIERSERLPVPDADGRVVAEPVTAGRPVPHYERVAMDGFAVRSADTEGASDRAPVTLELAGEVGPGTATRVHTGSAVPAGADAVVMVEGAERRGGAVAVRSAVAPGANVAPVGEDVEAGAVLVEPGDCLDPASLGLLRSAGVEDVPVLARPSVAVIPTGGELVDREPGPGEVVETNGLTVSRLVERWGGAARYRGVVDDDRAALRAAVERDLDADAVVTTGGSSVGERDLVPEAVADAGEVLVHGLAIKPGHPAGAGLVDGTPVLFLPGYPVSCVVTAVQLLRPTLARLTGRSASPAPATRAALDRKVASEPGVRSFVRVALDGAPPEGDDASTGRPRARPLRTGGAGVLSSVTRADGWVVVPESREGIDAGEVVTVQHWTWCQ